jgi:8-oxo-dGTP pyrophosphatase MutT (NUDIX family)
MHPTVTPRSGRGVLRMYGIDTPSSRSVAMQKYCDHTSAAVIIRDSLGRFALLERARFPIGVAPASGHVDNHGSPEQAAANEAAEELGLVVPARALRSTVVQGQLIRNPCRRIGGDHHIWWIYEATEFSGALQPSPDETKGAGWYSQAQVQELAERTMRFQAGAVGQEAWEARPGLEEVWVRLFVQLGYVIIPDRTQH